MAIKLLSPEALAQMDSLQVRARALVESVLTGAHRGNQRGFSIDFAEHRDYSPGDDTRFLDWKLFGRRDRYYVRQFEAENQVQAWLLLDVSGSMDYRSEGSPLSKLEYAACLSAAIGWISCYQRDQAALIPFAEKAGSITGPLTGTTGALKLVSELEQIILSKRSPQSPHVSSEDWPGLFEAVARIPSRSIVFLFSDAFGNLPPLKRALTYLRRKNCDTRLIHLLDSAELTFPFEGNVLFQDLEGTGTQQSIAQSVREEYLEEFTQFLTELKQVCGETHCQYWRVETSAPVDLMLRTLLPTGRKI